MSNRYGYESRGHGDKPAQMILDFYLTIGRNDNGRPSVRVSADYPDLQRHENTLNVKMALPLALWETPSLIANITVDAPAHPVQIDTTAIAQAVRGVIGMDVDIQVQGEKE